MQQTEINSTERTETIAEPGNRTAWKRWVQPLAAPDHPWNSQSFVVIYGFPTTGKSYLTGFLRSKGIIVWDTDRFKFEDGSPDLHAIIHALVSDSIPCPDVVVTDLTPSSFPFFYDMKFVRFDHEEVAYLSSQRGDSGAISKYKALGWIEALVFDPAMDGCIPLDRGRFILDYLITKVWR